jgi:hypothetical protein
VATAIVPVGPALGYAARLSGSSGGSCGRYSEKERRDKGEKDGLDNVYSPMNLALDYFLGCDVYSTSFGYRLPTESEWEYSSRAGAESSRYYGSSKDLLEWYAWYIKNSCERVHVCGGLMPNDLGLFDVLGNALEWCQDWDTKNVDGEGFIARILSNFRYSKLPATLNKLGAVNATLRFVQSVDNTKAVRGGAFPFPPSTVRSAFRMRVQSSYSLDLFGFRPAITLPRPAGQPLRNSGPTDRPM